MDGPCVVHGSQMPKGKTSVMCCGLLVVVSELEGLHLETLRQVRPLSPSLHHTLTSQISDELAERQPHFRAQFVQSVPVSSSPSRFSVEVLKAAGLGIFRRGSDLRFEHN